MAKVTYDAKLKLGSNQYRDFCYLIGFDPSSSSLRKLQAIGKNYPTLKAQVSSLPSNWTTLYEIAQLPDAKFDELVEKGLIKPNVLGKEIKALTDPNFGKKGTSGAGQNGAALDKSTGYTITVSLSSSPDKKTVEKLRKIIAECKSIKSAEVECSSLEEFLKPEVIEAELVAA